MEADVVVIGGGAIGASCALELARRGAKVTLLERGPHLAYGCSAGNAGLICPSHSMPIANPQNLREGLGWTFGQIRPRILRPDSPFYLRPRPGVLPWLARFARASTATRSAAGAKAVRELSVASLDLHAELAAQGLDTGFERRGTLSVYESEAAFAAARTSVDGEVLASDEVRELEPALTGELAGGIYHRDEAHCDPLGFVEAVGRAAAAAGTAIRTGVEVRRLRPGPVVETSEGELRPGIVVLAAGAWSSRLARGLGVFLPLEGGKGYHVDLEPAPGDPKVPLFMQEARTIATPLRDRLRLSGTMELAGLDLSISERRVNAIRRALRRVLGDDSGRRVLETWAGLRPCTPDGLPVIGRVDGLVLATGHAMKGLSLAPVTAKLVGELVAGEPPRYDLTPFSPRRFRPLLPLR
jgi:D-amino-acid dehydrogenase